MECDKNTRIQSGHSQVSILAFSKSYDLAVQMFQALFTTVPNCQNIISVWTSIKIKLILTVFVIALFLYSNSTSFLTKNKIQKCTKIHVHVQNPLKIIQQLLRQGSFLLYNTCKHQHVDQKIWSIKKMCLLKRWKYFILQSFIYLTGFMEIYQILQKTATTFCLKLLFQKTFNKRRC